MTDMPSDQELTQLLQRWSEGNKDALEKLMPAVYEELHRVAKRYMSREDPAHTLQTTALVNEVYLRPALTHARLGIGFLDRCLEMATALACLARLF